MKSKILCIAVAAVLTVTSIFPVMGGQADDGYPHSPTVTDDMDGDGQGSNMDEEASMEQDSTGTPAEIPDAEDNEIKPENHENGEAVVVPNEEPMETIDILIQASSGGNYADSPAPLANDSASLPYNIDESLESAVDAAVNDYLGTNFPGAVVLATKNGEIIFEKAYGYSFAYDMGAVADPMVAMATDTLFDLASVTKVMATTQSVMKLVSQKKLGLDDTVADYIPAFAQNGKENVTIRQLLTHTSGIAQWKPIFLYADKDRDAVLDYICRQPLMFEPGVEKYSDLGFQTLGFVIEAITGMGMEAYAEKEIYAPLGLKNTTYTPLEKGYTPEQIAATSWGNPYEYAMTDEETYPGFGYDCTEDMDAFKMFNGWREYTLQGEVNDGNAFMANGGVAGHAGLFSTASDLAVIGQMMLNGGIYNGVRIYDAWVIEEFTSAQNGVAARGLGFEMKKTAMGTSATYNTFGHSGFTGTQVHFDKDNNMGFILLTNKQNVGQNGNDKNSSYPGVSNYGRDVSNVFQNKYFGEAPGEPSRRLPYNIDTAIEETVDQAVNAYLGVNFPGAVVLATKDGEVIFEKAYGDAMAYDMGEMADPAITMDTDTLFDLASVTKVMATTQSIMKLVSQGKIELDAKVTVYIPEFERNGKENVTIRQLLTHTSGIAQWKPIFLYADHDRAQVLEYIINQPLVFTPGEEKYSDLGFQTLGFVIEAVTGMGMETYAAKEIYEPLGLKNTLYKPLENGFKQSRIAATSWGNPYEYAMTDEDTYPGFGYDCTEDMAAFQTFEGWREYTLWGEVNDGNAAMANGGVAGHAGLFSTASDLAVIGQVMLNGGELNGVRLYDEWVVEAFTSGQNGNPARGLGFEMNKTAMGDYSSYNTFGHSGFTGTQVHFDKDNNMGFILLTNKQNAGQTGEDKNSGYYGVTNYGRDVSNVFQEKYFDNTEPEPKPTPEPEIPDSGSRDRDLSGSTSPAVQSDKKDTINVYEIKNKDIKNGTVHIQMANGSADINLNLGTLKELSDKYVGGRISIQGDGIGYSFPLDLENTVAGLSEFITEKELKQSGVVLNLNVEKLAGDRLDSVLKTYAAAYDKGDIVSGVYDISGSLYDRKGNKLEFQLQSFNERMHLEIETDGRANAVFSQAGVEAQPAFVPAKFTDGKASARTAHHSIYYAVANHVAFEDIPGHWGEGAITEAANKGIVKGTGGDIYEPDKDVTRAEFVRMVCVALQIEGATGVEGYNDVGETDWYDTGIISAKEAGLLAAFDTTTYNPGQAITREEMAAILSAALKMEGHKTVATPLRFEDANEFSEAYKDDASFVLAKGIMFGMGDGTFAPKAHSNRAQAAVVLLKTLKALNLTD